MLVEAVELEVNQLQHVMARTVVLVLFIVAVFNARQQASATHKELQMSGNFPRYTWIAHWYMI